MPFNFGGQRIYSFQKHSWEGGSIPPLREHFSLLGDDSFMISLRKFMEGAFTKSAVFSDISKVEGTGKRYHIMKYKLNKTQE